MKESKKDFWSVAKDFCTSVQNLAVVIALIVGGWWTYRTFSDLESVNSSRAAIENLTLTNAKIRGEQAAINSAINLEIDATQLSPPLGDKNLYVSIAITAKNTGTKFEVMCFEEPNPTLLTICPEQIEKDKYTSAEIDMLKGDIQDEQQKQQDTGRLRHFLTPLHIARAHFVGTSQNLEFDDWKDVNLFREDKPGRPLRGTDVRPGQMDSMATVTRVGSPGVYRIAFSVLQPQKSTPVFGDLRPMWSASKFIVVRENAELRHLAVK